MIFQSIFGPGINDFASLASDVAFLDGILDREISLASARDDEEVILFLIGGKGTRLKFLENPSGIEASPTVVVVDDIYGLGILGQPLAG